MWFLTCLFLPLMQWSISLIKKKHLHGIVLEIVCHVIRYTVVHGLLFERHSLPSCPTQARVPLLGPPLISSQLRWTVIGSQTSVLFRLRAFSRAMEAPQKLGELIPPRDTLNQRGQGWADKRSSPQRDSQCSGSFYKVQLRLPTMGTASCYHFCIPHLTLLTASLLLPSK